MADDDDDDVNRSREHDPLYVACASEAFRSGKVVFGNRDEHGVTMEIIDAEPVIVSQDVWDAMVAEDRAWRAQRRRPFLVPIIAAVAWLACTLYALFHH
jgi:hypothetical protein